MVLSIVCLFRKSIDARLDDNSGSSGSPGGGSFAAPADKAVQRRADMRRQEQERRRREAVSGWSRDRVEDTVGGGCPWGDSLGRLFTEKPGYWRIHD